VVVAPNDVGAVLRDGFYSAASQDQLALGVESVGPAGDGTRVVDEARSGVEIEQRAGDGALAAGGVADPLPEAVGRAGRQGVESGGYPGPFGRGDSRRGCEAAATIVAPFAAGPICMRGRDFGGAQADIFVKLNQAVHEVVAIIAISR
jgi:hypothetical protein